MGIENVSDSISFDKKLYAGMTREEAYFKLGEDYHLFNFADDNCNDTISEAEIRRYNGPLLVVEKDDKTKQRFIGSFQGYAGPYHTAGRFTGQGVGIKEFDFYPGQKYDEIHDKEFNLAFRDLDLNSDGELSAEEIEAYQAYYNRKAELKQTIEENEKIKADNTDKTVIGGICGTIGGLICGGAVATIVQDKVENYIYSCAKFRGSNGYVNWDKVPEVLDKSLRGGTLSWVIGIGVAAVGVTAGLLIAKALHKKQEPLDKFDDLKPLDEQYKNVYNA